MFTRPTSLVTGVLGIAFLMSPMFAIAQEPPEKSGVEVLARGPVHEAYASANEQQPLPSPIIGKQPPAPVDELPPDQRPEGDNVVWLPGYWSWDQEREDFIWISGFWRVPPPQRVWMPGSWRQAPNGWQWVGGFWGSANEDQAQLNYLPAPPAPIEVGPSTPAPDDNSIYVSGSWSYTSRYLWRPGYWMNNRPGWIWTPATYRWTPAGYLCVPGYWDYTLADRGMLFAPVYLSPDVYGVPSYAWTPTFVVRDQCMFGALFVRRGFGAYYFGDYFDAGYGAQGFVSWNGYCRGRGLAEVRGWNDPMFSYYQTTNRNDPYWNGGINDLYTERYHGTIQAPARTFAQQNTIIRNTTINNKTVNVNQVQMLSGISQLQKTDPNVKLQVVATQARQDHPD